MNDSLSMVLDVVRPMCVFWLVWLYVFMCRSFILLAIFVFLLTFFVYSVDH